MESAIKKVLCGKTNHEYFETSEEWERLSKKVLEIYDEFRASLTEKQKEQFEEIIECECGQSAELGVVYYKEGFKLGLALAVEALTD